MKIKMLLDNCFNPDVRVYKEAKYLVDQGHDVEILAMDKKNSFKDKEYDNYKGIKIKRFYPRSEKTTKRISENKILNKLKKIIYIYWLIRFVFSVKKYLKNKDYAVIHSHDYLMAFIAVIVCKRKIRIFDMHEYYLSGTNKYKDAILKKLIDFIQKHSDYIIYVNPYQCKDLSQDNMKKTIFIPNYPDKNIFTNIKKSESKTFRISYIGAARDFDSLSKLLYLNDSSFTISIHGMGSCYDVLYKEAQKLGVVDRLTGSYEGVTEIEHLYQKTDLLYCVYQANCENWKASYPVKSYEAIITLTPLIVNKDSSFGAFVSEKNIGYCIDTKDDQSLENLLTYIKEHPNSIEEKKKNLLEIQFEYTWDKVVKNLDKIYLR